MSLKLNSYTLEDKTNEKIFFEKSMTDDLKTFFKKNSTYLKNVIEDTGLFLYDGLFLHDGKSKQKTIEDTWS